MSLHHTYTERIIKYLDVEHEIFDEDYKKEVTWLGGLFKITRGFKLRNTIEDTSYKRTVINGLKNK
jgi:hypothetical protein